MGINPQEIRQMAHSGKELIDNIKELVRAIKHNNQLLIEHGRIMKELLDIEKEKIS